MMNHVLKKEVGWQWLDLLNPSQDELKSLAKTFHLHKASVHDCLDPEHLPKFEAFEAVSFTILRAYDDAAAPAADSVQALTRKVAMFAHPDYLITIHRQDQAFLQQLRDKWQKKSAERTITLHEVLHDVIRDAVLSYRKPLSDMVEKMEAIEDEIFKNHNSSSFLADIFYLKRKASVFKRILLMTEEVLGDLPLIHQDFAPLLQDLKDEAHRLFFIADKLADDINNLLNFHLSLAQHRANDIMRILTLITVFFIPLTFLVGVYGMNFHFMPELDWKWGYAGAWGLILAITGGIYTWFRKKRWL